MSIDIYKRHYIGEQIEDHKVAIERQFLKGLQGIRVFLNGLMFVNHKLKFYDTVPTIVLDEKLEYKPNDNFIIEISYDKEVVGKIEKQYEKIKSQVIKRDNPKTRFTNLFD